MIRTQVYIPEDIYRDLKFLAKTSKENISQLIREGADEVIKKRTKKPTKGKTTWGKGFIGAGKGGPKNLSKNIDRYTYGASSVWAK